MSVNWTSSHDELDALLERWRGARAEAWAYRASHGTLYVALQRPLKIAYLQFKDCQSIQFFRTAWEHADIAISRAEHRPGTLHTVIDPGNLHVVCWAAFGTEGDRFALEV